jgi:hypothetical protein
MEDADLKVAPARPATVVAALGLIGPARADLIPPQVIGTVTALPGGLYRYDYTVPGPAGSGA